jgi:hypothetical protein
MDTIKDMKLKENMIQMLEMGYNNFEVNLNLLKRNANDLIAAVNSLCNGLVSESMFMLV